MVPEQIFKTTISFVEVLTFQGIQFLRCMILTRTHIDHSADVTKSIKSRSCGMFDRKRWLGKGSI